MCDWVEIPFANASPERKPQPMGRRRTPPLQSSRRGAAGRRPGTKPDERWAESAGLPQQAAGEMPRRRIGPRAARAAALAGLQSKEHEARAGAGARVSSRRHAGAAASQRSSAAAHRRETPLPLPGDANLSAACRLPPSLSQEFADVFPGHQPEGNDQPGRPLGPHPGQLARGTSGQDGILHRRLIDDVTIAISHW